MSRDALTLSIQAFHRFAPSGLQTPDQHFFTVHDAATDTRVGWLWYQVRDDGLYRSAYLCDIAIFDEYQRQGYGTACLAEVDNQAKGLGISRVGLHVFGHNTEAIELYQRCGYKITDCTMAKDLRGENKGAMGLSHGAARRSCVARNDHCFWICTSDPPIDPAESLVRRGLLLAAAPVSVP